MGAEALMERQVRHDRHGMKLYEIMSCGGGDEKAKLREVERRGLFYVPVAREILAWPDQVERWQLMPDLPFSEGRILGNHLAYLAYKVSDATGNEISQRDIITQWAKEIEVESCGSTTFVEANTKIWAMMNRPLREVYSNQILFKALETVKASLEPREERISVATIETYQTSRGALEVLRDSEGRVLENKDGVLIIGEGLNSPSERDLEKQLRHPMTKLVSTLHFQGDIMSCRCDGGSGIDLCPKFAVPGVCHRVQIH